MLQDSCSISNCLNYLKLTDHCVVYPATWSNELNWNCLIIHQEKLKKLGQITILSAF